MQYELSYRPYAEALYDALQEDAFYVTMEKSVSDGSPKAAMIRYLDYSIVEAQRYGRAYFSGPQSCGVSVWSRPLDRALEDEKHQLKMAFLNDHMGARSVATYTAIVDFMSEQSGALIDEAAWYLSILGILPAFQGQGVGVGLVNEVLTGTDYSGVPTYLETFTPRNIPFYQRLGYRAIERFHEPTTGATYWLMVREVT